MMNAQHEPALKIRDTYTMANALGDGDGDYCLTSYLMLLLMSDLNVVTPGRPASRSARARQL